jgi:hypothetical protein
MMKCSSSCVRLADAMSASNNSDAAVCGACIALKCCITQNTMSMPPVSIHAVFHAHYGFILLQVDSCMRADSVCTSTFIALTTIMNDRCGSAGCNVCKSYTLCSYW